MNNNKFQNMRDVFLKSKKYWLIYLLLITIMGLSTISKRNFQDPTFEILIFIIVAILGILAIMFYFSNNNRNELHKVAFVIIIIFGIMTALIVPICDVSDELEHLTRAEITSQGVLIPHWTGDDVGIDRLYNQSDEGKYSNVLNPDVGFETIKSMFFFSQNREKTVFDTDGDTNKIDYSKFIDGSAFEQNPFFGYLPQAIGIFIAKLLDLNVIWMLWLARIGNLICYATLISLAIRRTPVLKMPMLAVACIPIAIYQSASASIDSMIIGLGILAISYFIYMIKADEKSIELNRDAIDRGIVNILKGSVSDMPFYDETFDIVTGFETIYFWPDFINDLKEVNRVLKKGGLVFFCNEAVYREGEMEKYDDLVELLDMKIYSEDVLKQSLEKTGFKDFKSYINDENDWICITAVKI